MDDKKNLDVGKMRLEKLLYAHKTVYRFTVRGIKTGYERLQNIVNASWWLAAVQVFKYFPLLKQKKRNMQSWLLMMLRAKVHNIFKIFWLYFLLAIIYFFIFLIS